MVGMTLFVSLFVWLSGRNSGDLVFPLVFCPELHFSEFGSAVADMKNSVMVRTIRIRIIIICNSAITTILEIKHLKAHNFV